MILSQPFVAKGSWKGKGQDLAGRSCCCGWFECKLWQIIISPFLVLLLLLCVCACPYKDSSNNIFKRFLWHQQLSLTDYCGDYFSRTHRYKDPAMLGEMSPLCVLNWKLSTLLLASLLAALLSLLLSHTHICMWQVGAWSKPCNPRWLLEYLAA